MNQNREYLYRIQFRDEIKEHESLGPKSPEELNQKGYAISTFTPIQVGDTIRLEGKDWKVVDIFREFALIDDDEREGYPYSEWGTSRILEEEQYGPIVKVIRAGY